MKKPAHESLGLTESAYNAVWSSGYQHYRAMAMQHPVSRIPHKPGSPLRKAFDRGISAARREYGLN